MHRSSPLPLILVAVLVACQAGATPSPSGTAAPATTTVDPTLGATASPLRSAEPVPTEALGEFSCEMPVVEQATAPVVSNIVDVQVGTHDDYDRVVFEFATDTGTPEFTLDRAQPPFKQDGSGNLIEVEGDSFLGLTMRGGTKQTATGESSYDGPTDFDPGFPTLVDLVEGGDFEAQSTWYFGLSNEACVRVSLLTGPDRVVIDVEH